MSGDKSIGTVYINDPGDEVGGVYTGPFEDRGRSFPRHIGEYRVMKTYYSGTTPISTVRVTLSDGTVAQGKLRADRGGYVSLYPAAAR